MEKKTFDIQFTETYSKLYEGIEAESFEEATEKLWEDIAEGREEGPDECIDSNYLDVTEEEPKVISLNSTELNLLIECVLTTLNQIDESKKVLSNSAAIVSVMEEERLKYYNLFHLLADARSRE